MKKTLMVAIAVLSAGLLGACGSGIQEADQVSVAPPTSSETTSAKEVTIRDVLKDCNVDSTLPSAKVGDGGSTLTMMVMAGPGSYGIELAKANCVFKGLALPDSLRSRIDNTRPSDGQQQATWDGHAISWTISKFGSTFIVSQQ